MSAERKDGGRERRDQRTAVFLPMLFGLSGASALIYELTWSRTLQFIFGSTMQTASTIFAGFLVGFSWGAMAFRKPAEKTNQPLRHLGTLELAIGFYGLCLPAIVAGARAVYSHLPDVVLFRLGLCLVIVLIPAMLFGGLWPYVGRCGLRAQKVGTDTALLYSANSAGSALGAFAAGFVLIPAFGLTVSSWVAAALNLLIGALFIRRQKAMA